MRTRREERQRERCAACVPPGSAMKNAKRGMHTPFRARWHRRGVVLRVGATVLVVVLERLERRPAAPLRLTARRPEFRRLASIRVRLERAAGAAGGRASWSRSRLAIRAALRGAMSLAGGIDLW